MIVAGLCALIYYLHYRTANQKMLKVTQNGKIVMTVPLNRDYEKTIQNGDESNTIVVKDGKASVSKANCTNQICVNSKAISEPGETIACLPHKLILEIVTGDGS